MRRAFPLVCLVGALGCGPVAPGEAEVDPGSMAGGSSTGVATTGGGSTSGSSGSSTGNAESTMITSSPEAGTVVATDDSGQTFVVEMDEGGPVECDVFSQNCPPGQKCMPYADDGGSSWNNTKCVPVMEDPAQLGEPCFAVGNGVSGIDNCDLGLYCWDVDGTLQGTCIAMCMGTYEEPICPPKTRCIFTGYEGLNLCIGVCDPLIQDCPMDDDLCIPSDTDFVCVLDASGDEGQVNDPCMFANACDKGLYCIVSSNAAECDQASMGCCQPFCDLSVMEPDAQCAGVGQACVPWFEAGTAPPGYEFVGICAVPM